MSEPGSNAGLSVSQGGRKAYEEGICHACQAGTRDRGGQLFIHKAFFKSEPEESKVGSEQHTGLLWAGGRTQPGTHRKGVTFLMGKPQKPRSACPVDLNRDHS